MHAYALSDLSYQIPFPCTHTNAAPGEGPPDNDDESSKITSQVCMYAPSIDRLAFTHFSPLSTSHAYPQTSGGALKVDPFQRRLGQLMALGAAAMSSDKVTRIAVLALCRWWGAPTGKRE